MQTSFLAGTPLFDGITEPETETLLGCLGSRTKRYAKGAVICRAGDAVDSIGLVLSGVVHIERDDMWGNKSILGRVDPGQIFAETYACIPGEPLMVNAVAAERCEILFINAARLLTPCASLCGYHNRLIRNLLRLFAQKNLGLSRRILHTSSKSIRGRLLSYLSEQAALYKSHRFTIPFNRQQLADYLGVDRSAMSNELSKMRREGILEYDRNHFWLK